MRRRHLLLGAAALATGSAAQASDTLARQQGLRPAGQGLMRVWGFDVYRARLWVAPGFQAGDWGREPLLLALNYLRAFSGRDIAERSITEMRRVGPFNDAQAARWQGALATLLPDVRAGDTLTGWHRPGQGAEFWRGDTRLGELADPAFSRLFFGIWLSEQTSAPELRQALLAPLLRERP